MRGQKAIDNLINGPTLRVRPESTTAWQLHEQFKQEEGFRSCQKKERPSTAKAILSKRRFLPVTSSLSIAKR